MKQLLYLIVCALTACAALSVTGCGKDAPPEAAAVKNREQVPIMVSRGVSKLISDSGITRYKLITEEWAVFDQTDPPRQDFKKGILILRLDKKMAVDMQITADTAYWYDQHLWELRGRVYVENEVSKVTYRSEKLYWDMNAHEFYSDVWMHVVTPEREVEGTRFRANEQMTKYEVDNDRGSMPMPKDKDKAQNNAQNDSAAVNK